MLSIVVFFVKWIVIYFLFAFFKAFSHNKTAAAAAVFVVIINKWI